MKISIAKNQFNYAVWYVLNQIDKKRQSNPQEKVFDYMVNIDVKHASTFLYGLEADAINFLIREGVIGEVGEADIVEFGNAGTAGYKVFKVHHFKLSGKFGKFCERYTKKVESLVTKGEWRGEKRKARLIFSNGDGTVTYTLPDGKETKAEFRKDTSEYRILIHLARNKGVPQSTSELIEANLLKEARKNVDYDDQKQRVIDKIKPIREKLGKDLVKKKPDGYVIDCDVVFS